MYPEDYIVIDTETTGLSFQDSEVIEIAAIKYHRHQEIDRFQALIKPQNLIPYRITTLNGIDNTMVKDMPSIASVLPQLFKWLQDSTLIGHNIQFDVKMLNAQALKLNLKPLSNPTIDTLPLAKQCFPTSPKFSLEFLKNYLGLQYLSHRALDDVLVTATLYQIYHQKFPH